MRNRILFFFFAFVGMYPDWKVSYFRLSLAVHMEKNVILHLLQLLDIALARIFIVLMGLTD